MKLAAAAVTGMSITSIVGYVAAQTIAAAPDTVDAASWLMTYGPWSICVVLGGTVTALAKAYVSVRDRHERAIQDLNDKHIELFQQVHKTLTELATKRPSGPTSISAPARVVPVTEPTDPPEAEHSVRKSRAR